MTARKAARPVEWQRRVGRDREMAGAALQGLITQLAIRAKGTGPHAGTLFASHSDLAAMLDVSERYVSSLIHKLIGLGYLEMTQRGGYITEGRRRSSEYRLLVPEPTGTPLPVEVESQPALEDGLTPEPTGTPVPIGGEPTGTQVPIGQGSQPELGSRLEPEPTGTERQSKREKLPRELASSADQAAEHVINRLELWPEDHRKLRAALQTKPDPMATAKRVSGERVSQSARSRLAVVLARIRDDDEAAAKRRGRVSGGPPAPAGSFPPPGSYSWDEAAGEPVSGGWVSY